MARHDLRTAMTGYQSGSFAFRHYSPAIRHRFPSRNRPDTRRKTTMVQTVQKNIRVTPEQWQRIEKGRRRAPKSRPTSSSSSWPWRRSMAASGPAPEAEIHLLRSAMFTAQAMARDMASGRTRRRDRRNRAQHLQNRPGIAARDPGKRMTPHLPWPTAAPRCRRSEAQSLHPPRCLHTLIAALRSRYVVEQTTSSSDFVCATCQ